MATPARVLVVGETPSLADAVVDLLESDGHRVVRIDDPGRQLTLSLKATTEPVRLVISASNGFACATAARWMRNEVLGVDLLVVGSRDPNLRSGPRVHVVNLPLAPDDFLHRVRALVDRGQTPILRPPSRRSRRAAARPPRRGGPPP